MSKGQPRKSAKQESQINAATTRSVDDDTVDDTTERIDSKADSLSLADDHPAFLAWLNECRQLEELDVSYEEDRKILWIHLNPKDRPSVSRTLAEEGRWIYRKVAKHFESLKPGQSPAVRYLVCGSHTPGIFSMGGDLPLFESLARDQDRESLLDYAMACIDLVYANYVNLELPLITISLVQGDALGGGFEAAISNNVVVAERGAKFGLPECLFNLFPGMGAYSLIARRIGPLQAERMILSGRIYSAEELLEIGLVDWLVEDGEGMRAVHRYVDKYDRQHAMRRSVYRARRRVSPLSYDELRDITVIWVDTVLELSESDLRKMSRLAAAQDRRLAH